MMELLLLLLAILFVADSKDYCKGLENVPGIPKLLPKVSYIVKDCHRKNMAGWRLMAAELNMSVIVSDKIPETGVDIVWSPFEPVDIKPSVMYVMGPEFDVLPGNPEYSGWDVERYKDGHAFYNAISTWNVDVHAGMGGWKYPMVALKYPADMNLFKSPVPLANRRGGFIYFKRRKSSLLAQVQNFISKKGMRDVTVFHYVKR